MHARIKCLVDLFPRGNLLLDIGSDHGYLGLELLRIQKATEVWNVDLSRESLRNSRRFYDKYGFTQKARFICGDGFTNLEDIPENAVVVVAGLGSQQILRILEHIPPHIRSLILMSHTDYFSIRRWAGESGWKIHDERYLEDRGYFYMAMRLMRSFGLREEYSPEDYLFGKRKFREEAGELFRGFWAERSRRFLKIPEEHRNPDEKEVIRFLIREKIVKNLKV